MNTTTAPFLLSDVRTASRVERPGSALYGVLAALAALVMLAVGVLMGASIIRLIEPGFAVRTSPGFERIVVGLATLLVVLAIPMLLARRTERSRRLNPAARPRAAASVLLWNLMLGAAIVLFTPDLARSGLRLHGHWTVGSRADSNAVTRVVDSGARWAADRIPTQTPLTLTHHTTLPTWGAPASLDASHTATSR